MRPLTTIALTALLAGLASAQDGTPPDAGGGDDPQSVNLPPARGEVPPDASQPVTQQQMHEVGLHGYDIQVVQQPIRIAPGAGGKLVLIVRMPKGRVLQPGGKLVFEPRQGPVTLGTPAWDPLPKGKPHYDDAFSIQVPISIDGQAEHGRYEVKGILEIAGDFRPSGPAEAGGIVGPDGGAEGAMPPPQPGVDYSKGRIPFNIRTHVGPPMARPGLGAAGPEGDLVPSGTGAGGVGQGGQGEGPGETALVAGGSEPGQAQAAPIQGTGGIQGGEGAGAPSGAELAARPKGDGFPWGAVSAVLVVAAGLLFVVNLRRS